MSGSPQSRVPAGALVGFAIITLTLLLLQIVQSRLLAATLTYYYAFILISLAMLGLAAGSMTVRGFPRIAPQARTWERASMLSIAMGVAIAGGTLALVALLPMADRSPRAIAAVAWCTFPAYFCGGLIVAVVLTARRELFHRLYAVDLGASALGCILAVVLLDLLTPVQVLLRVAAVAPVIAGVLFARAAKRGRLVVGSVVLCVLVLALGVAISRDPTIAKPGHVAFQDRIEVLSEWNATSAVRVYTSRFFTWSLSPLYSGPVFETRDLIIDGMGGTPIVRFDGRPESLSAYGYLDADVTALPHHLVSDQARQLIIGPGGGIDILQSIRAGRKDVTAVEINPLVATVVNETLKDFSGAPYSLPGVHTVIDNGRTFIKRARERWDLLTLTWVDTGGSATALAYSENYLYTVEAFDEYLSHLTPDGMLAFLRAWNTGVQVDSLRGVAVAVEALRRRGVSNPADHILIAGAQSPNFPRMMCLVLVSREPFSRARVDEAERFLRERAFVPVALPGRVVEANALPSDMQEVGTLLHEIVTSTSPEQLYRESTYDIAPSTDDNPFYFVERAGVHRSAGAGVSQLSGYLVVLATLVTPFLLVPAVAIRRRGGSIARRDFVPISYFSLLGLSYMFVEVELFHLMGLLLGKPTLTLAVVLCTLLVFSGIGSLLSKQFTDVTGTVVTFGLLILELSLCATYGARFVDAVVHLEIGVRLLCSVLIVAPIAFCMGMPLPAGMRILGDRGDLVLWGWAANGAVSVFASVAAIYFAIHLGIGRTLALGCLGYAAAGLLLWARPIWPAVPSLADTHDSPASAGARLLEPGQT